MNIDLVVIYTDKLDACRDFYAALGLPLVPEQHGSGPEHYAAVLDDGTVFELYPATGRPATGYLRLGLIAEAGRRVLTDPDGRTIVLTPRRDPMTEEEARETVTRILGPEARAEVTVFPAGNLSLMIIFGGVGITADGGDSTGWGWSIDPTEESGFTGHDHTAGTLAAALRDIRTALAT
ncbi:glyoxalase/bleomycin resistance/dioxygenase family protein [Streptomyces filamentosus]|uniref:glyoxalase/bleomycin resistance/dioxygenase family protein n=1 Tax=Streptomyces filamentosus TaxID=67294 RepID=UPI0033FAEFAC